MLDILFLQQYKEIPILASAQIGPFARFAKVFEEMSNYFCLFLLQCFQTVTSLRISRYK